MIVIVDERQLVTEGYSALFSREGMPAISVLPKNLDEWIEDISDSDISMIEAFMLGKCEDPFSLPKKIKERCSAPVLFICEENSLEQTLQYFQFGADDVLRKPMHVREILARIAAIRRRGNSTAVVPSMSIGPICVFNDGRDPKIYNEDFPLPRRERRILEYLVTNNSRRVSKTQIFNAVYGIFDTEVEESVIESHISKLRRKLKAKIGYDVIDSKRFLGYRLVLESVDPSHH